ncbi:MAG: hypothetical protein M3417_15205 [Actinomycetota bacterium]|nr:hypothetical protein [Actinomycetota bacterium]
MTSTLSDRELDGLIDEITIDCYDEDEVLTAFEVAFDEDARLPCPGTVIGEPVEVVSIGLRNGRRELVATCQHAGSRHDIALLDVDVDAHPALARLIAAYRRWLGAQDGAA